MIRIDVRRKSSSIEEVLVNGHAGGKESTDIVCSAVSAVTQTTLAGLLHYTKHRIRWSLQRGQLCIRVSPGDETGPPDAPQLLLTTMLMGLSQIACRYPDKVVIYLDGERMNSTPGG